MNTLIIPIEKPTKLTKIELTKSEDRLVRLCKGRHPYKRSSTVLELIFKHYRTHYNTFGGTDEQVYKTAMSVMFSNLLNVYMLIREGKGYKYNDLETIFFASFGKSYARPQELPIERAIAQLYGLIQSTKVRDKIGSRYYWRFNYY